MLYSKQKEVLDRMVEEGPKMKFSRPNMMSEIFYLNGKEIRDNDTLMIKWPDGTEELHCVKRQRIRSFFSPSFIRYWIMIKHNEALIKVTLKRSRPDLLMAWPEKPQEP